MCDSSLPSHISGHINWIIQVHPEFVCLVSSSVWVVCGTVKGKAFQLSLAQNTDVFWGTVINWKVYVEGCILKSDIVISHDRII